MKTMMAAAAALMLIAGQSAAATSDIAATTTTAAAAPGAHARTANYCDVRQMRHGAGDKVRLHAANRCDDVLPGFSNTALVGGAALLIIGFAVYEGTKGTTPASP